ncbi:glycoside hydrolase family 13 protein [Kineothrix sp. MB12-C1]|uniref:glycoside hydrolase family 13 protein n=1 Tax=Kineothrix sp. MB12-C1 TaxID=3070215 RepID=UPI0027D1F2AD|nr:alpha-glucosidase [Kineothrix sp. MB12-C1]WMC93682.1 alpha-glucosidase [Kineothrix sp. MB12-C1]
MKKETISEWWKSSVIYQIYPRSFKDSNQDGIGDLQGIIQKLDYLKELGIEAIWLSPVCKSPQDDNGYDISDYQDIDPMFGSMKDMEELIEEGKKRGIRIILDLVLNHSSDEHPWFVEAKKSVDNPYHGYYVWRDGVEGLPPNDMRATFGGSAWEWVPELKQYYFHQFSPKQPDLNWDNEKVREEIYEMIQWWMDKGIGGFRLDVIDQIAKEPDLKITANGPKLHDYIKELSKNTFQKADLVTVGEAWGADIERAKLYSNPDRSEFSMVFQFEHIVLDQQEGKEKWDLEELDFIKLKKIFAKWQKNLYGSGWNSLFWNNHDLPRIVSRWGNDKEYRVESAKMLASILHGMQGTPYIYQGEELGMTNVNWEDIDSYRDIETLNIYKERLEKGYSKEEIMKSIHAKGRDNARTPMQWSSEKNGGFSDGIPWIKINENYPSIHAEDQLRDPNSIFHYYRQLIQMRKDYPIIVNGEFELLLEEDKDLFCYTRKGEGEALLVIANFHGKEIDVPILKEWKDSKAELLLCNYKDNMAEEHFRAYEARIYYHSF